MLAFVTVGSTRFDSLIHRVLSEQVLTSLRLKGYRSLIVQSGNSEYDAKRQAFSGDTLTLRKEKDGVHIEIWQFKPSLMADYERADLVISHAGSGTILDVLRLGKPLIVVPNPTLLDNHQDELASSLASLGHLRASTLLDLSETVDQFDTSTMVPFPPFDGSKFRNLLDKEMGLL